MARVRRIGLLAREHVFGCDGAVLRESRCGHGEGQTHG